MNIGIYRIVFIAYVNTDDIYKDIEEDVETSFDTSNYELDIPLTKEKKTNWINDRWIRWKTNERVSWTDSKNL